MKRNYLSIFIFLSSIIASDNALHAELLKDAPRKPLVVRGCQQWGFFAEFLWTLNYLEWCLTQNQIPIVKWGKKFAYYSPDGYNDSTNCWEYYFEPVSSLQPQKGDIVDDKHVYNKNFTTIWWYSQYIDNKNLLTDEEKKSIKSIPPKGKLAGNSKEYPRGKKHLYSKEFRTFVKEQLLDKFVKIKPSIQEKIDAFYRAKMEGKRVIGVHLRGKFIYEEVSEVPVEALCEEANQYAGPNTVFLVATDQTPLLETAKNLLNGEVISYDSFRQQTTTSPEKPSQWYPKLGEDVLIEAKLLSFCDHFIHTISNVSTAVLYFNPDLPHTMLYCGGSMNKN